MVVVNFMSIDGVVQSPLSPDEDRDGGFDEGGWVVPFSDNVVEDFMRGATVRAAGMLLGRRSYEILAADWAEAEDSEPAVAAMNLMPKHVVTSSSDALAWANSHRVTGELGHAVTELKRGVDGDLVVLGAAQLVQGLAERDLVDEYRLLVFPVVLGTGKRMFGDRARPARFALTSTDVTPSGVAIHSYTRSPDA